MKIKRHLFIPSLCGGLLLAGFSQAQAQYYYDSVPGSRPEQGRGAAALLVPQYGSRVDVDVRTPGASVRMVPLSRITGATVQDRNGNTLGYIQDVVADTTTGHMDFAIVRFHDRTTEYTAVPWTLLNRTSDQTFVYNGDRETFRNAQTFTSDRWPDFTQPRYVADLYRHYGLTWPTTTASGAMVTPGGVVTGGYYDETRPWTRPQPDGHETFPRMITPEPRYR